MPGPAAAFHPAFVVHTTSLTTSAGKPLFGTLIALLHNGVPILGVIDQPILKERWIGAVGQHTLLNGR
jgi:hypothetical protein